MSRYLGAMASLVLFGYMAEKLPYIISLIFGCLLFALGGAIYALSTEGWMLVLGYAMMGCGVGVTATIHTYIGEMGSKLDDLRRKRKKKPIKYIFYIMYSFFSNGGFFVVFCKFQICWFFIYNMHSLL